MLGGGLGVCVGGGEGHGRNAEEPIAKHCCDLHGIGGGTGSLETIPKHALTLGWSARVMRRLRVLGDLRVFNRLNRPCGPVQKFFPGSGEKIVAGRGIRGLLLVGAGDVSRVSVGGRQIYSCIRTGRGGSKSRGRSPGFAGASRWRCVSTTKPRARHAAAGFENRAGLLRAGGSIISTDGASRSSGWIAKKGRIG